MAPYDDQDEFDINGEDVTPDKTITNADKFVCLYTSTMLTSDADTITWMANGIFDSKEAAFGSVLGLVNVKGIKVLKVSLPTFYLPLQNGVIL